MKQSVTYQGLFLIALGLYGYELSRPHLLSIKKDAEVVEEGPLPSSPELAEIYKRLKIAPVFTTPIDGVKLTQTPRTIQIEIKSDELYRAGEVAVEDTWLSAIDQVGSALFEKGEPKADLIFMNNATSEKDAFEFSASRAEWVLRYLSRKYQLKLNDGHYKVMGLGHMETAENEKSIPSLQIVLKPVGEL